MYEWSEVVETRGDYRVILVVDENTRLDGDCYAPSLMIPAAGRGTPKAITAPHKADWWATKVGNWLAPISLYRLEDPSDLEQLAELTDMPLDELFVAISQHWEADHVDEWLKRYRDTTVYRISAVYTEDLVVFDCPQWRQDMGIPLDARLSKEDVCHDHEAWINNEVYGIVVEELVEWTSRKGDKRLEWEKVESCFGFFGRDYAKQEAMQMLASYIKEEK